LESNIPVPRT